MLTVLRILAVAVVVAACALVLLLSPLPAGFPPPQSHARNRIAAAGTGIVALIALVWLATAVAQDVGRATSLLDPVLDGRGLTRQSYVGVGRRFTGNIGPHAVEVTFVPAAGVQAAQLDVYVNAQLRARAALGPRKPLLDCRDCPQVMFDQSPWDQVQVYAADESWVRAWLAGEESGSVLARLVTDLADVPTWALYVQPERLWLHMRAGIIAPARLEAWLDWLLQLAQSAR